MCVFCADMLGFRRPSHKLCGVVLQTLVPHSVHELHTKYNAMSINLVYSLHLSSHADDSTMTAGHQLRVMDKVMQWFLEA